MRDYTTAELDEIRAIVGANATHADARSEIARRLGFELTSDALQKLFKRRGWGTPTQSLAAGGGRMVDVSGLDYDSDIPAARDTLPGLPAFTADRSYVDGPELRKFTVPRTGSSRWLFIPDTHVPYASRRAWLTMLAAAREWKPDGIVICGDFADFHAVSFHEKGPHRGSRINEEVQAANAYLDEVDTLGAKWKLYAEGNHEARLARYIAQKASALVDLPGLTLRELFRLGERGWQFVDYLSTYQIGDCLVTHTTEKFGGVLSARKARDAFNASAVVGHCHRLSYELRGDYFGNVRVGMAVGCLFDFDSLDYEHKARAASGWAHGFGTGVLDHSTGHMHLAPVAIVNGRCSVNGRLVEAA